MYEYYNMQPLCLPNTPLSVAAVVSGKRDCEFSTSFVTTAWFAGLENVSLPNTFTSALVG